MMLTRPAQRRQTLMDKTHGFYEQWQIRLCPELGLISDPADRHDVWMRARRQLCRNPFFYAFILVGWGALGILYWHHAEDLGGWLAPLALLIGAVLILISIPPLFRRALRRSLRRQLLHRGIPLCIKCGHDLRGSTSSACPECGANTGERTKDVLRSERDDSDSTSKGDDCRA